MNLITLVEGIRKLVKSLDFLDFSNSSTRIRLTGTSTVDRLVMLPDNSGTIALEDPDLIAISGLSGAGVINRLGEGSASILAVGSTGSQLLSSGDAIGAQNILQLGENIPIILSDNYTKFNTSIKTGGLKTEERWLFLPIFSDNYTRIVLSRGYNDDSYGYGSLSVVIEVSSGVWGSSGEGAFLRIQKINEYGWPGAFVGATSHLLREVRVLESSGAEVSYSGLWLKVMGDRTYKISGCAGLPSQHSSYIPTIGSPLAIVTAMGMGTWARIKGNYYAVSNGEEIDPVVVSPNGSRWRIKVDNTGNISSEVTV